MRDTLAFADTTPISNQLTINIGVAQTVCFRLVNQSTRSELEESKNSSEEKTGIKPNEGRRTEALPNHLHTLTVSKFIAILRLKWKFWTVGGSWTILPYHRALQVRRTRIAGSINKFNKLVGNNNLPTLRQNAYVNASHLLLIA